MIGELISDVISSFAYKVGTNQSVPDKRCLLICICYLQSVFLLDLNLAETRRIPNSGEESPRMWKNLDDKQIPISRKCQGDGKGKTNECRRRVTWPCDVTALYAEGNTTIAQSINLSIHPSIHPINWINIQEMLIGALVNSCVLMDLLRWKRVVTSQ